MAQNRYDQLKTALYEHIKEKRFCDDRALLTWLVSRLDDWVEQLEPGAFSCQKIVQTDFFGMMMVNIEMIDEIKSTSELKPMFPEQDWMEFRNAVTWLEKTRDREEASLVERTYQKFKDSFAAVSGQNSNDERADGVSQPSLIEWWRSSPPLSPFELKTTRAILSLAILLLPVSICIFVNALLFSSFFPGLRSSIDIAVCFFFLSVLFFALWLLLRLWFKARRVLGK